MEDANAAYAQGIISGGSQFPAWAYYGGAPNGRRINDRALSMELEGHPFDGFMEPQIAAAIALGRHLVHRYGIPLDREHVVGHYRFDHVDRANCPGPKFPWDRVMAGLA